MAKPGRKPAAPTTASPDTSTGPATKSKGAGKAPGLDASGDRFTSLLEAMNTKFGKGTLRAVDADSDEAVVDVISTGSLNLDIALGIGGYPRGRIVEIYGPESSGKTTLTLHAIANAQKLGLQCVFIDAEHALDVKYAKALGVDTRKLLISQPDSGEAALDLLDQACKSGGADVIIVDSIAALTPKAELDGDMTQSHVGLQARMMSRIMRKIASSAAKGNVLVLLINQIRMKIGVMFGSPETTSGGQAVKYFASVRLDIRRIGGVKEGGSETFTGNATKVTVKKNKMAPPFKEVEFPIVFGTGIDNVGEMMDMGKEHGIFSLQKVDRSGAGNCWFYDPPADSHGVIDTEKTIKLGNSREPAKAALAADPKLQAEVRQRLLDKLLTVKVTGTTEADRAALAAKIESEKYVPEAGLAAPGIAQGGGEDEDPLAAIAAYAAEDDGGE